MKKRPILKYKYLNFVIMLESERKRGLPEYIFGRRGKNEGIVRYKETPLLKACNLFFKKGYRKCSVGFHPETGVMRSVIIDNNFYLYYEGKNVLMEEL